MVSNTEPLTDRAEALKARAIGIDGLVPLGRLGWVANGIVHGLVGVLAVPIAFGGGGADDGAGSGDEASRTGAVAEIAERPYGGVLLWGLAAGLVLYALWRLVTAFLPGDSDAAVLAHRAGYLASAVVYGLLASTAVVYAVGSGGSGSGGSGTGGSGGMLEDVSRTVMGVTAGRWLLAVGALIGLGGAGYLAHRGWNRIFLDEFDLSDASSREREFIEQSGMIGWIGRAVTTALLAGFVLLAAINADPDEARGLDAALRDVADNRLGSVLVLAAALGLIGYGVFAIVSARRRLLVGP